MRSETGAITAAVLCIGASLAMIAVLALTVTGRIAGPPLVFYGALGALAAWSGWEWARSVAARRVARDREAELGHGTGVWYGAGLMMGGDAEAADHGDEPGPEPGAHHGGGDHGSDGGAGCGGGCGG